ncbi:MAG TPA: MG2 domain-containing protein [Myxococcota bacterium]|nr:MG2 domain-containing protein [Myxococcota bacterium]HRY97020.1 MG2 domain-containing protein [Myxococcota bacterium]
MQSAARGWKLGWVCLLVGVLGLGLGACAGGGSPGGEVTERDGLKLDESRLSAVLHGGELALQVVVERTRVAAFAGLVAVTLEDLDGNQLGRREVRFRLNEPEVALDFEFRGLPQLADTQELGRFLIRYQVGWDDSSLYGRRSLYAMVEKVEAQVLAPAHMYAGTGSFLRVLTRDPGSGRALAGLDVRAELQLGDTSLQLGAGVTDEHGTAEVYLQAPADAQGGGKLVVTVRSQQGGEQQVEGSVDVLREEKILLTTDKPLYQPGQVMHLRSLALRRPELRPVGDEEVLFEVRDGKGNKVFKMLGRTDAFGVAAADFHLASEVNLGDFELLARVGTTEARKSVEVKRYALPKYGVSFRPDRGYYLPGERVTGQVSARYFFGQPVGGEVRVKVYTFDVGLAEIGEVVGALDADGLWSFGFDLPTAFAGIDLLQGNAYLQFDVEVTDLAAHTERVSAVSVVASSSLAVALIPESGELVPGLPNRVHVVTADPTGMPVPAQVEVSAAGLPAVQLDTDARGFGSLSLTPPEGALTLHVEAADALGNQVEKEVTFQAGQSGTALLLRVDRRLAQVGDTLRLSVFAADSLDRVYLDVIKGNQTLLTHSLDLVDGQASYELEATPDMAGNVQFDAYYLTRESQIVRDSQLVLVEGARELAVEVSLDKPSYLPGETAQVAFQVRDQTGNGVPAALGLAVVDEAVFALSDARPGLAETFFEIEQDILAPRVQAISSSALDDYLDPDQPPEEREAAAEVAFAAARGFSGYGIEKNTYVDAARLVSALVKARVDRDAEGILAELRELADLGVVTHENLRAWFERGPRSWYDPFGQAYRAEVHGSSEWDQTVVFLSSGPDELAGSPDDVASNAYYSWYIMQGRNGGWWGEEDMAGGADPGGQPPYANDGGGEECAGGQCGAPEDKTSAAPRVRSYFPETLYVNPALLTDASGRAELEIPLADSITTWRMSSLASSLEGQIGSRADGLLVFQPFFVDVDFPATLTRGDEVSVPVAVYNYLDVPQRVDLEAQPEPWFSLIGSGSQSLELQAGGVGVVFFSLRAEVVGWHGLTVTGIGSAMSDAVRRTVEIVPDGKEFRVSHSDRLGGEASATLSIPAEAIDGASRIFVKVYPGLMSQAVEGLDALLQIPSGCFEQTTTTAWPNIMVLNYLRGANLLTPAIELKARDYVNQSYQRILTFECPSGGFNWWVGDDPGNSILSAMALMMFADARQSVDLDLDVVARTEAFLVSTQQADGSWSGEDHLHAGNEVYGQSQLRASAFCTWGLAMSDRALPAVDRGVGYLLSAVDGTDDTYTQALVACALAWADPYSPALASLLAELDAKKADGGNGLVYWPTDSGTASGACGQNGDLETTALVAQAMMQAGSYLDSVDGAITWLIQHKDSFGTWSTTQGTVQGLRAMTQAMDFAAGQDANGTVRVGINGHEDVCDFAITPETSDVTRICELDQLTGEGDNAVSVGLNGTGSFLYQVVGVYYLPWELVGDPPGTPLSIQVEYDRTNLGVDETVEALVTVSYNVPGERVAMIMIDLGIPPGFDLLTEDLAALANPDGPITRFEVRGRQLSVYVDELAYGEPLSFSFRLRAKFPVNAQSPASAVWAYYNPEVRATSRPVEFVVAQ